MALFLSPLVGMVASDPPITAPALVVVGSLMAASSARIDWEGPSESLPAFLTLIGLPLTFSIAGGLALGLACYPILKLATERRVEVHWLLCVIARLLVPYSVMLRAGMG